MDMTDKQLIERYEANELLITKLVANVNCYIPASVIETRDRLEIEFNRRGIVGSQYGLGL